MHWKQVHWKQVHWKQVRQLPAHYFVISLWMLLRSQLVKYRQSHLAWGEVNPACAGLVHRVAQERLPLCWVRSLWGFQPA